MSTIRRAAERSAPLDAASITVLKIGGSVLTGLPAYRTAASFVASRLGQQRGAKLVVVVSAEHGQTDALLHTACELSPIPNRTALDLLWSTGEMRSVALLVLALESLGVRATATNVHQTGLIQPDLPGPPGTTELRPLRLRSRLASNDVLVVPGFLARGSADRIVSLGRGGSDLTAVLLAAGLGARTCELVKDVDGYYSADPNLYADAHHVPAIDIATSIGMAEAGCGLVQREALEAAQQHQLTIVIRSITGSRATTVQPESSFESCAAAHSATARGGPAHAASPSQP
jgi:aspartate kinase